MREREKEKARKRKRKKERPCVPARGSARPHIKRICENQIKQARERWGAGVETPKNVRGEIGGWGRVPFNETYAPLLSTIYDGA